MIGVRVWGCEGHHSPTCAETLAEAASFDPHSVVQQMKMADKQSHTDNL